MLYTVCRDHDFDLDHQNALVNKTNITDKELWHCDGAVG